MSKKEELIDGHTVEHLYSVAEDIVKKKTKHSVVLDREAEARIPKFAEKGTYRYVVLDVVVWALYLTL